MPTCRDIFLRQAAVMQLHYNTIYGIQNGKNGAYLKYYREDSKAHVGDKPDGVNLIITEPEEGMRVTNYQIFLDFPIVGDEDVFNLKTHNGRYIITRHRANVGSDVIASENVGSNPRAHWTLKNGNFRTNDGFCLLQNVDDSNLCLYCTGQNTLWLWSGGNLPVSRAKPAQHWRFVSLGTKSPSVITTKQMQDRYQKLKSKQTQFIRRTKEEEDNDE